MMLRCARWLALLSIVAAGACASTQEGPASDDGVAVEVRNNLIPPTTLTVYAVPEVGVRELIGTVRSSATATLAVDNPLAGPYRFLARTTEGREIVSNPITLGVNNAVLWDVDANLVTPQ